MNEIEIIAINRMKVHLIDIDMIKIVSIKFHIPIIKIDMSMGGMGRSK